MGMKPSFHVHVSPREPYSFVLRNEANQSAIIIDPGEHLSWCKDTLESNNLRGSAILLTAGSLSYAARAAELSGLQGIPVFCHVDALLELQRLPKEARDAGLCGVKIPKIQSFVDVQNPLVLGGFRVTALESTSVNRPKCIGYEIGENIFVGKNLKSLETLIANDRKVFPATGKPFRT